MDETSESRTGTSDKMRRFIELAFEIELRDWPGLRELAISFEYFDVSRFCCELALLMFGRADRLTVKREGWPEVFVLNREETDDKVAEFEQKDTRFEVRLGANNFDYMYSFFLAYYRDGSTPVNHIHLEDAGGDQEVTIYVEVPWPAEASNEAKKILGKSTD